MVAWCHLAGAAGVCTVVGFDRGTGTGWLSHKEAPSQLDEMALSKHPDHALQQITSIT